MEGVNSKFGQVNLNENYKDDEDYQQEFMQENALKKPSSSRTKKQSSKKSEKKSRVTYKPDTSAALLRQQ